MQVLVLWILEIVVFRNVIIDNIDNNKRNGKKDVSFLDHLFHIQRFVIERTNVCLDTFKATLGCFETKKVTLERSQYHSIFYYFT